MTRYHVYLEIADDGQCFAHVPDLPGCVVRAPSRDEALRRLLDAIRDYHVWLCRHGEPTPYDAESIEIEVAGESREVGPFDPGDAAALFPPDREPVTAKELEHYFGLMAYSRADLLSFVRDLPGEVLDWQPDPDAFSVRRLLRHVGNAEEWYVSRIVPPETLPAEWEGDEDLPIFAFLEMERRTCVAWLRQLTAEAQSRIFYPTRWTDHPNEPWTARKVLRRFLEHEREHTAQIREILRARRDDLLARLDAERAKLLEQLAGLEEQMITKVPIVDNWTVKDVLAHIAAWDRWAMEAMQRMLAGQAPDLGDVANLDAFNAAAVAAWRHRTWKNVLAELRDARATWVGWMRTVPVEAFFRKRKFGGDDWHFPGSVEVQWRHDAEHAEQIAAWRDDQG